MKLHKWQQIRRKRFSEEHIAKMNAKVEHKIIEMNLKKLRQILGKTQEEVAEVAEMSQSQLSKTEISDDHLVSTLRRCVEALGGELEVIARFNDRMVKLTGV